jgi:hypothetical protein
LNAAAAAQLVCTHTRIGGTLQREAEMPAAMAGLANDACVVASAREHKRVIGVSRVMDLVDGPPRSDVVAFCPDDEHRHADVLESGRASADCEAAGGELVVEIEALQILCVIL